MNSVVESIEEAQQSIKVVGWILRVFEATVAHANLVLVTSATGAHLGAPESAREIIGCLVPLTCFHEGVEGVEAGETGLTKVVSHVDKDVCGALARDAVAIDLLLALPSDINLLVEELLALALGEAATAVNVIVVSSN